jgi:hypothetical protein
VPEARPLTSKAGAFACGADVLAGETAADDIHGNSVCLQSFRSERTNVIVAGHLRPMLRQDTAGEGLDLAEGHRLHPGALQAEAEATNA